MQLLATIRRAISVADSEQPARDKLSADLEQDRIMSEDLALMKAESTLTKGETDVVMGGMGDERPGQVQQPDQPQYQPTQQPQGPGYLPTEYQFIPQEQWGPGNNPNNP